MFDLLLAVLATYGVATLFADYSGPYDIFVRIRTRLELFRCVICLAVWCSVPISHLADIGFVGWLATIGGVILLERIID